MTLSQGSAFLNKKTQNFPTHLWVVLSDPDFDSNKVVIVNISSWRDRATVLNDNSCILKAGEHPFIEHKSYAYYRCAKITSVNDLERGFNNGVLEPQDNCSPELLDKILLGASKSMHIDIEVVGILQEQGLLD